MDLILLLIVIFYIGFQVGSYHTVFKLRDLIIRDAISKGIHVPELSPVEVETETKLIIEHHKNCLYLFDGKNNQFICQANTIEDLAKVSNQYKNIKNAVVFDSKTSKIFKFSDGKIV